MSDYLSSYKEKEKEFVEGLSALKEGFEDILSNMGINWISLSITDRRLHFSTDYRLLLMAVGVKTLLKGTADMVSDVARLMNLYGVISGTLEVPKNISNTFLEKVVEKFNLEKQEEES